MAMKKPNAESPKAESPKAESPSAELLSRVREPEFWLDLNPGLHITDDPFQPRRAPYAADSDQMQRAVEQVRAEGYTKFGPLVPPAETRPLAAAIGRVIEAGLPAPMAIVYDEVWSILGRLTGVLEPILGSTCRVLPDLWIWHVDGVRELAGWSIHRDDELEPWSLREDGSPLLVTIWIPFTDVTPESSCMYVLPTNLDSNYPDNLAEWAIPEGAESSIRALPARAGSMMLWNQYALHWGSLHSPWAAEPRISLAVYVQCADAGPFSARPPAPGIVARDVPTPPTVDLTSPLAFEDRLAFAARMIWKYCDLIDFSDGMIAFCEEAGRRFLGRPSG